MLTTLLCSAEKGKGLVVLEGFLCLVLMWAWRSVVACVKLDMVSEIRGQSEALDNI